MNGLTLDWGGVLTGAPVQWLFSGLLVCVLITIVACLAASLLAFGLLALRISPLKPVRALAIATIELFRNTPLLVQLFFWYFAAYTALPEALRELIIADHPWATMPGNIRLLTPEFVSSAWGLAWFGAAFLAEEMRSGLKAVPPGQYEAAISQGFSRRAALRHVLIPQALRNAWQPMVGQYQNLMKLSSLASGIGLSELTYRVREIETFNAHVLEAYALGTALYLGLGLVMGLILNFQAYGHRRRP